MSLQAFQAFGPGRKPSGVVRTGFGAPKKKVVRKDRWVGWLGWFRRRGHCMTENYETCCNIFGKKIPQQNDRGFWLCLNLPQMGKHPCQRRVGNRFQVIIS